jgi:tetratricopeptide (TPR) repeat protein
LELDPLNSILYCNLGVSLAFIGRPKEAESSFERALQLNPQNPNPHLGIGNLYLLQGRYEEGLAKYEEHVGNSRLRLLCRALAYPALGRQADGDAALKELIDVHSMTSAYQIAEVYAVRGETDEAFAWLERAYEQHDLGLVHVKIDTRFENLHNDARWPIFLNRMGRWE